MNEVNDGFTFISDEFKYSIHLDQNIFFLHGAFHIYQKNRAVFKITQTQNKALYDRLEEILEDEDKDIICVFTNDNKEDEIAENIYLSNGIKKLKSLNGSLVIIGSSLAENDKHIFRKINESSIAKIYFAVNKLRTKHYEQRLNNLFPSKEIILFDRDSITYEN